VPRAVPIVEAMAALVLADMALLQEARVQADQIYPLPDNAFYLPPHTSDTIQPTIARPNSTPQSSTESSAMLEKESTLDGSESKSKSQ